MINKPWWRLSAAEMSQKIRGVVAARAAFGSSEAVDRFANSWLYHRESLIARYGSAQGAIAKSPEGVRDRVSWLDTQTSVPSPNIVRAAIDTVVAWLYSEHAPVGVSSAGVPFEKRFAVEDYESALDTLFNSSEVEPELERAARDATISGLGAAMPSYCDGKVGVRRLAPHQVIVDPFEARSGKPKSVHVIEEIDREGLLVWLESWNGVTGKRKKLAQVNAMEPLSMSEFDSSLAYSSVYDFALSRSRLRSDSDRLVVVHSWRAASRNERPDGRYVLTVFGGGASAEGLVLFDQKFASATIPVCFFAPMPDEEGIGGTGFAHLMRPWQEALDRSFFKLQRALDKYGHLKIVMPLGAQKLMESQLQSYAEAGVTVLFGEVNNIPKTYDPQVLRREDLDWITQCLNLSQSIHGINEMMSRGASQLGAGASGVAQQEEYYRSLDRFTPLANAWRRFRLRLAEETLRLLDETLEYDDDYAHEFEWNGQTHSKRWCELSEQVRGVTIRLELRGPGASTRAGRIARIQEQASQGLIDQATAQEGLLNTPDVRWAARMATSGQRLVDWQIRNIIEDRDIDASLPDRDTPLDIAITRATAFIRLARVEGAEPETLERLRAYKDAAEKLVAEMTPPAPPPALPPEADLGGIDPSAMESMPMG